MGMMEQGAVCKVHSLTSAALRPSRGSKTVSVGHSVTSDRSQQLKRFRKSKRFAMSVPG